MADGGWRMADSGSETEDASHGRYQIPTCTIRDSRQAHAASRQDEWVCCVWWLASQTVRRGKEQPAKGWGRGGDRVGMGIWGLMSASCKGSAVDPFSFRRIPSHPPKRRHGLTCSSLSQVPSRIRDRTRSDGTAQHSTAQHSTARPRGGHV